MRRAEVRQFLRRAGQFLNEPPKWFCRFVWFYPLNAVWLIHILVFVVAVCPPLAYYVRDNGCGPICLGYLLSPLLLLLFTSGWFRERVVLMVGSWFFTAIFLAMLLGMTQGALTSAVTKAFSAAVANGTK